MPEPSSKDLQNLRLRSWRLSHLGTILVPTTTERPGGLIPFEPNWAQRAYFNSSHFLETILKARKLGFSTLKCVEFADLACIVPKISLGIIDATLDDAKEKLQMVRRSYEHLDDGDIHPHTWRLGRRIKAQAKLTTDSKESLEWSNGARLAVSTSFRGRTPDRLLLSEFGKISAYFPKRAQEIVTGAFNSVLPGSFITSESTHEGGPMGHNYDLNQRAIESTSSGRPLTPADWKFHFFPWYHHPAYVVAPDGRKLRPDIDRYFHGDPHDRAHPGLEKELGRKFSPAQKLWYDIKENEQGYAMKSEFPSTPGEAFEALVRGAIWGKQLEDLKATGRLRDLGTPGPEPLQTFWDIGYGDYTAIWLIQESGIDFLTWNYHEDHQKSAEEYVPTLRRWEAQYGRPIDHHFLPHDADTHDKGSGKTPKQFLIKAGIHPHTITVVPRPKDTPSVWRQINHCRQLLRRFWFHKPTTGENYDRDGEEQPSGFTCLANYRTKTDPTDDQFQTNTIVHDRFSHPADAFRTFGAADLAGLRRHAVSGSLPFKAVDTRSYRPGRRR